MKLVVLVVLSALGAAFVGDEGLAAFDESVPVELDFKVVAGEDMANVHSIISAAVGMVESAPSPELRVHSSRDVKATVDFMVYAIGSHQAEEVLSRVRQTGKYQNFGEDAFSAMIEVGGLRRTAVFLIVDRLMYERQENAWVGRSDALTRTAVALGHEVYGNVLSFHRAAENDLTPAQEEHEVHAYQAGVDFIDRFLHRFGEKLPEKTVQDFLAARAREVKALERWKETALCKGLLKPDPRQLH